MTTKKPSLLQQLARYRKSAVAVAVGLVGWGAAVVVSPSGPITAGEWVGLGSAILTALGVYTVANAR